MTRKEHEIIDNAVEALKEVRGICLSHSRDCYSCPYFNIAFDQEDEHCAFSFYITEAKKHLLQTKDNDTVTVEGKLEIMLPFSVKVQVDFDKEEVEEAVKKQYYNNELHIKNFNVRDLLVKENKREE